MPKAINTFTDKIVSDLDRGIISPNQWVFPTMNVRIFNKDGKGFIASTLPGNELLFSISDGFVVLGVREYNGILYIASHNEETLQGEIGSYPSVTNNVFVEYYKPLHNLSDGPLGNMTTTRFEFDLEHQVDIVIKPSYDDSVDLYICDWKNPNRVINSGFNQSGVVNTRVYTESHFDGAINQISFTVNDILIDPDHIDDDIVVTGGYLKPGNYFLYFRYLTSDYAKTNFIKEIGPLSVVQGNTPRTVSGLQEKDWLRDIVQRTDKKIVLQLSNLDVNFSYFEIGVARYTGMQENADYTKDSYLIDKYYPIGSSTTQTVEVYGNESEQLITYDELIKNVNEYNICRSQTQIFDRWLGVNWKREVLDYDKDSLELFAQKVTIGCFHDATTFDGPSPSVSEYENNTPLLQGYADGNNVYKYVGYFKGQIYPFAMQFKFTNGSYSDWFPCKGVNDPDINGEYKGLYKFPNWKETCDSYNGVASQKYLTGVTFNAYTALTWLDNLPAADTLSKFGSVIGFRFGRGERVDNLICQGVVFRGFHGICLDIPDVGLKYMTFQTEGVAEGSDPDPVTQNNPDTASVIPLFHGNLPIVKEEGGNSTSWYYGNADETAGDTMLCAGRMNGYTLPRKEMFYSAANYDKDYYHKHGIFSPDILFDNHPNVPVSGYVETLFSFLDTETNNMDKFLSKGIPFYLPLEYVLDLNEDIPGATISLTYSNTYYPVLSTFVENGQYNGMYHFNSYLPGDGPKVGFDFRGSYKNRNIYTSRYAGIVDNTETIPPTRPLAALHGSTAYEQCSIVNLYRYANDSTFLTNTRSSFNVASEKYAPITEVKLRSSFRDPLQLTDATYNIYKGDCFLQKTWFRQSRWRTMEIHGNNDACGYVGYGNNMLDACCNWYQHGLMVGIITENKFNTEARNDVTGKDDILDYVRYTSYPKVLSEGIDTNDWARGEGGSYLMEALQINDGYNHLLSDDKGFGFDFTEPIHEDEKPNRTYVSDAHSVGSYVDGYRQIGHGSFRDYGLESGPIVDITKVLDYPVLIHERGINQLYLNEKNVQPGESGDFILGSSVNFLGDRIRQLATYGTQHKSSIVDGFRGIYGFDSVKRFLWRIDRIEGKGGGFYLGTTELVSQKLVQKRIKEIMDGYFTDSSIMNKIPDTPLKGFGIVGGYDPEFSEILVSILYEKDGIRVDKTIVFDEALDGFRGEYSFTEPFYCNLGNMLLSLKNGQCPTLLVRDYCIDNLHNPLWSGLIQYVVGNSVLYLGIDYRCIKNIDSDYIRPNTQPTYWEPIITRSILMPVGSKIYEAQSEGYFALLTADNIILSEDIYKPEVGPWSHRSGPIYTSLTEYDDCYAVTNGIYRYNRIVKADGTDNYNTFFGIPAVMQLSFIVNGLSQDAQNNTSKIDKIFEGLIIESKAYLLHRILFETMYQKGTYIFQTAGDSFWLDSEYLEHKWHVPIVCQTSETEEQFDTGGEMKGLWMKVTIEYTGVKDLEIKSVETSYNILNS